MAILIVTFIYTGLLGATRSKTARIFLDYTEPPPYTQNPKKINSPGKGKRAIRSLLKSIPPVWQWKRNVRTHRPGVLG